MAPLEPFVEAGELRSREKAQPNVTAVTRYTRSANLSTAPFLYNPRESPAKLASLLARPGVVPYGRYKNLPLETRAKEHFPASELNAKIRSKKVNDFVFV